MHFNGQVRLSFGNRTQALKERPLSENQPCLPSEKFSINHSVVPKCTLHTSIIPMLQETLSGKDMPRSLYGSLQDGTWEYDLETWSGRNNTGSR